jgi:glycosyltransferase involved in cell wall biosynthesis
LPEPPAGLDAGVEPGLVTVVATYSKDEPLGILPAVAERLPDARFAVTGAPRGDLSSWPANLTATGFLSDAEYWRQLARSAAIVVLTTRPATLLSGGYEAMAVGRPLVISDHDVLRDYFADAAVYAGAASGPLSDAVSRALAQEAELAARITELRRVREDDWRRAAGRLRALLGRDQ